MRVVVRGGGSIGKRHATVLRASGHDVRLWPVRRRPLSDSVRVQTDTLLLDDEAGASICAAADLVIVATDTARHVADAIAALDAGAARVMVEKPLASSLAEAAPLVSHPLAFKVSVAAPLRAHAAFGKIVQQLPEIGDYYSAIVQCQSWLPSWRPERDYRQSYSSRLKEGGVLRDLVHELDYSLALFGPPELLFADVRYEGPLPIASDQAATLVWQAGHAQVTARLDYISSPGARALQVHGVDGSITWDVLAGTVRFCAPDGSRKDYQYPLDMNRDVVLATQHEAVLSVDPSEGRATRFATGYPASLNDGLAVLELCDHARAFQAGKSGRPE